jgi:transcriptional regulator with XRE-family HTH domain
VAVGTTRGKRRLGRYLRPMFERSGLKIEEVATAARCSRQTVSRLFSGDHLPRFHLFTTLLTVLKVTDDERAKALELWEVADADTYMIEHAQDLPGSYMRFRMDESEARLERTLNTVIIPGLLQTAAYASAKADASKLLHAGWDPEREAAERRDRQGLLRRADRPLGLHALVDEVALRRLVGGPDVMAEQLDHLLTAGRLPNVTIQVIPFTAGAYGAMSGPLWILTFPEDDEPDAAYVESLTGVATVEDEANVAALSAVWDGAAAAALSPTKSATFIRKKKKKVKEPIKQTTPGARAL